MHKPRLGDTLPVYVGDKYEEFSNPQPMVNLVNEEIEKYDWSNISNRLSSDLFRL